MQKKSDCADQASNFGNSLEDGSVFAKNYTMEECGRALVYVDCVRNFIGNQPNCCKQFKISLDIIWALSHAFLPHERTVCHAMSLICSFIHQEISGNQSNVIAFGVPFKPFWIIAASIAFKLAMTFHETSTPTLCDIMAVHRNFGIHSIEYTPFVKKLWKSMELRMLGLIEWKLCFTTSVDLFECMQKTTFYSSHLAPLVHRDSVYFAICLAYSTWDMLLLDSHTITLSSIAAAVAYNMDEDSFSGIFHLLSIDEDDARINECATFLRSCLVKYQLPCVKRELSLLPETQ